MSFFSLQIVSLRSLTKKLENDKITGKCGTITVSKYITNVNILNILKTQINFL